MYYIGYEGIISACIICTFPNFCVHSESTGAFPEKTWDFKSREREREKERERERERVIKNSNLI